MKVDNTLSAKTVLIAQYYAAKFNNEYMKDAFSKIYKDESLMYIKAIHHDENGFFDKEDSFEYCWYIPNDWMGDLPVLGDILVVEANGQEVLVHCTSNTLPMTRQDHIENLHPYCPVIKYADDDDLSYLLDLFCENDDDEEEDEDYFDCD